MGMEMDKAERVPRPRGGLPSRAGRRDLDGKSHARGGVGGGSEGEGARREGDGTRDGTRWRQQHSRVE